MEQTGGEVHEEIWTQLFNAVSQRVNKSPLKERFCPFIVINLHGSEKTGIFESEWPCLPAPKEMDVDMATKRGRAQPINDHAQ